jgi:hypothetical protein
LPDIKHSWYKLPHKTDQGPPSIDMRKDKLTDLLLGDVVRRTQLIMSVETKSKNKSEPHC